MGHGPARPYVSRRQFLQRTAAIGLMTAAGPVFWQRLATAAEVPPEQVHGQFGADAGREAAFSWMTPAAVATPFAQLGEQRILAETVQYAGYPGFFHHVRVDDLLPGTTYPYAVGHADVIRSDVFSWKTGPRPGTPFVFTAFGDQGTDSPDPTNVQDVDPNTLTVIKAADQQQPFQASFNRELAQSMNPAFHAIVGDTSYANGDQAVWDQWFRGLQPMATNSPWMPCLGNHEIETMGVGLGGFNLSEEVGIGDSWGPLGYDAYRHRFALPSNGDPEWEGCWYRFRYGSVELISIDNNDVNTEITPNVGYSEGRQRAFVERTLKAAVADPDVDFIVVLMHQAAFSSGLHGSDQGVRDTWFSLFNEYGVDLVIQGHDHHYERTHLMTGADIALASDGDYVSDIGTMYVVTGNGGSIQRAEGATGGGDFTAKIASQQVGTLKIAVVPDTGEGTRRLILSEYSALTGEAIEEGIVIERTRPAAAGSGTEAGSDAGAEPVQAVPAAGVSASAGGAGTGSASSTGTVQDLLPATGGPAGTGLLGAGLVAGAAGAAIVRRRTAEPAE